MSPVQTPEPPGLFFFGEEHALEERRAVRERNGHFTGERLKEQKPVQYAEIVRLRGLGESIRAVAAAVGVSVNTVQAVERAEGLSVETLRAKTVAALGEFVSGAAERFADELHTLPIDKLAVPFGIAADKLALMTGGVTARVEVVTTKAVDAWAAEIDAVLVSAMGLGVEGQEQKEGATDASEPSSDMQSLVYRQFLSVSKEPATHCATDDRPLASSIEGGEGSQFSPPPADKPIHSGESESGTKEL